MNKVRFCCDFCVCDPPLYFRRGCSSGWDDSPSHSGLLGRPPLVMVAPNGNLLPPPSALGPGAQWSGSREPVMQLQSGWWGPGSGRRRGLAVPRGLSGTLATPTWPPPGAWAPQCSTGTGFQRTPGRGEPQDFCDPASKAPGCHGRWSDWPSKSGDRSRLQKRVNVPSDRVSCSLSLFFFNSILF